MSFPQEFSEGMKHRREILGDDGASAPEHWDPIWQNDDAAHIWLSINGQHKDAIERRYAELQETDRRCNGGVTQLSGHRSDGGDPTSYQDASAIFNEKGEPQPYEHFGYFDGIGDPIFEGQGKPAYRVKGRGRLTTEGEWIPLQTGEFLLGHIDEAGEYPPAPVPYDLAKNGCFMVYRKLHENVGSFNKYLEAQAAGFAGGKELLAAKIAGRWRQTGAPVTKTPDEASHAAWVQEVEAASARGAKEEVDRLMSDFTYGEDIPGGKCPVTAHIRRLNPRGSLEYGQRGAYERPGALVDRRRVLRRGLPYGAVKDANSDNGEYGAIIMIANASIRRQFEFVQQQWVNYANDFKHGSDKDVLLGNHDADGPGGRFVVQAEPGSRTPPHILKDIPRFVETRGGDYFFIPGMTALRLIGSGTVDPT